MSPLEPLRTELIRAKRFEGENPDPRRWNKIMRQKIATHLDDDGNLSIKFDKKRKSYKVVFQFVGSSKVPILLCQYFGGTVFYNTANDSFQWCISQRERLASMLRAIKPYVCGKTGQVNVALQFLSILDRKPEGYKAMLARLKVEMGKLNDTGARREEALRYWESLDP